MNYEDYVKLQKEKTTNKANRARWLGPLWKYNLKGFKRIFSEHEPLIGERCLCLGARTGQEVQALIDMGRDAIGIDLVPHEPLVIEGDFHNLDFEDNSFNFVFSNVFDHALYPSKFLEEIGRVLVKDGISIIHLQFGIPSDKYGVYDVTDVHKDFVDILPSCLNVLSISDIMNKEFDTMTKEAILQKV